MNAVAVIGSVFVDVKGYPFQKYLPTGRNVGDVKIIHGGVCRNTAENFANIGAPVSFVTMFENDAVGDDVRRRLSARGVDLKYAVTVPAGMGMWLAVFDEGGQLAGSISRQPDFSHMQRLIEEKGGEIIKNCGAVVLEVDMRAEIADRVFELASAYGKDVYAIVGNMSVILKRPELLRKTRLFILNEIEAGELFSRELDPSEPYRVLEILKKETLARGIREIVVTLGSHGAVYFDALRGAFGHIPAEPVRMVDSTGAGDAFFSGTVAGRLRGLPLEEAVKAGTHLAALTIQTEESSCPVIRLFS